jgi:hypothetical protein
VQNLRRPWLLDRRSDERSVLERFFIMSPVPRAKLPSEWANVELTRHKHLETIQLRHLRWRGKLSFKIG